MSITLSTRMQEQKWIKQGWSYDKATDLLINIPTMSTNIEVTFASVLANMHYIFCRGDCPMTVIELGIHSLDFNSKPYTQAWSDQS